ncbi:MAG: pyrroline-5-carboxylate reductase [Gammaproteobacteria bacterium]
MKTPSGRKAGVASGAYRVAIVGGGHLGRAVAAGLVRSGIDPFCIRVGEPDSERRLGLERDFGVMTQVDNCELVEWAEVVLVAIRPSDLQAVLTPLQPIWGSRERLVVSLAAGMPVAQLHQWIPNAVTVIRAMPNLAVEMGQGAIAVYAPDPAAESDRKLVEGLFGCLGKVFWLGEEDQLNLVTALSGSGPAYFYYFMEQLEAAAVAIGMERDLARLLVLETGIGSMALAQAGEGAFQRLREQVTSPGGTTAAALTHLARPEFSDLIAAAVRAAYERGRHLAHLPSESKP